MAKISKSILQSVQPYQHRVLWVSWHPLYMLLTIRASAQKSRRPAFRLFCHHIHLFGSKVEARHYSVCTVCVFVENKTFSEEKCCLEKQSKWSCCECVVDSAWWNFCCRHNANNCLNYEFSGGWSSTICLRRIYNMMGNMELANIHTLCLIST